MDIERLAKVETIVEEHDKKLEFHAEMLGKHEVACEIHAPKAASAHEGFVHMGTEIAVVSEAIKTLVNVVDEIQADNKEANKKREALEGKVDQVLLKLANMDGEKEGLKKLEKFLMWVGRGLLVSAFGFALWTFMELQERKYYDETHKHKVNKAIKRDKSIDKEDES
jgi:hypothetical protein